MCDKNTNEKDKEFNNNLNEYQDQLKKENEKRKDEEEKTKNISYELIEKVEKAEKEFKERNELFEKRDNDSDSDYENLHKVFDDFDKFDDNKDNLNSSTINDIDKNVNSLSLEDETMNKKTKTNEKDIITTKVIDKSPRNDINIYNPVSLYKYFDDGLIIECLDYWNKYNYYTRKGIYRFNKDNLQIIKDKDINTLKIKSLTLYDTDFDTSNYYFLEKLINSKWDDKRVCSIFTLYDLITYNNLYIQYQIIDDINENFLYSIEKYKNGNLIKDETIYYLNLNKIVFSFKYNSILSKLNNQVDINYKGVKAIIGYIKNIVCYNSHNIYSNDKEKQDDINLKFNYVMNFIKAIFLKKKNETILLLSGMQGSGKTTLINIINKILGNNISVITEGHNITDRFNHQLDNLFIGINEFDFKETFNDKNKKYDIFKNIITSNEFSIQKKYKDVENKPIYTNFIITTNTENLIKLDNNDRRFVIFQLNFDYQQKDNLKNYFQSLYDNYIKDNESLNNFYNFVLNTNFSNVNIDEFIHQDAILTKEKQDLIYISSNPIQQYLLQIYYQWLYVKKFNIQWIFIKNNHLNTTFNNFFDYFLRKYYKNNDIGIEQFKKEVMDIKIHSTDKNHHAILNISFEDYKKKLTANNILSNSNYTYTEDNIIEYTPFDSTLRRINK